MVASLEMVYTLASIDTNFSSSALMSPLVRGGSSSMMPPGAVNVIVTREKSRWSSGGLDGLTGVLGRSITREKVVER